MSLSGPFKPSHLITNESLVNWRWLHRVANQKDSDLNRDLAEGKLCCLRKLTFLKLWFLVYKLEILVPKFPQGLSEDYMERAQGSVHHLGKFSRSLQSHGNIEGISMTALTLQLTKWKRYHFFFYCDSKIDWAENYMKAAIVLTVNLEWCLCLYQKEIAIKCM